MAGKTTRIMYIELKSGRGDCGPARIGRVSFSKSGLSIYYRNKMFQRLRGSGVSGGNYFDSETGDEYWISGPKHSSPDRHWAGGGVVHIDRDVAEEYWRDIRKCNPCKEIKGWLTI
jgi:hypothetical protein